MAEESFSSSESPIAAIATAPGPAGVCVVRLSGAGSLQVGDRLVSAASRKPSQQANRSFFYARILHPVTGDVVDDAVLLIFRPPHSYTGEEALEIQGHGGSIPARKLLDAVLFAGARLAEPGEFTKRAFLNGRLDLTQAEAVCDFIQAKTDRAAHVARAQLDGALGQRIGLLYEQVTNLCAEAEHLLDFDEGELPVSFFEDVGRGLLSVSADLERLVLSWNEGHLLRDGALVVISGRPNAGKSSLLNALLERNRAIVNEEPGTTRDVIEESISLGGVPLRVVDTAVLRETENVVEQEGINRARTVISQADLNLYLIDQSAPRDSEDERTLLHCSASNTVIVLTKSDCPRGGGPSVLPEGLTSVRISVVTGEGLNNLRATIIEKLGLSMESSGLPIVSLRHVTELRLSLRKVQQAREALSLGSEHLVVAANLLREAAEALGRITGRIYSNDLLDTLFSRFCVGK